MPSDAEEPSADPVADAPQPGGAEAVTGMVILDADEALSRRQVLAGAGGAGLLAAAPVAAPAQLPRPQRQAAAGNGTPEQIHLTWGRDPATSVAVSWASPEPAVRPRVLLTDPGQPPPGQPPPGQPQPGPPAEAPPAGGERPRVMPAVRRTYTDGISGEVVCTYHVQITGLSPGSEYSYAVTADNDASDTPFSATFRTAPRGRRPFRFTSFGDLATPNTEWVLSYGQSAYAVAAVESFEPLFHLLNGDLCYADLNPAAQPAVWRDFGSNTQSSAARRAWMPCPGNHEIEFGNGPQGLTSYLTRYTLPDNGVPGFRGRWYSFRVGSALFISLDADDVVHQDAGPFVAGPQPLTPAASTGNPPIPPGASFYIRGYSGGAQTAWLERTLAAARADHSIDWIIVQMHQDAMSSSATGNGSDLGIRQAWLPLFDAYEVDLVLCGHDHDYERSFPVRGFDSMAGRDAVTGEPVQTMRPHPVTTIDSSVFDASAGTVHLVLGCGGTAGSLNSYGVDRATGTRQAKVFTHRNRPAKTAVTGVYERAGADALEDATWSAMRDTSTGYGIAVFDVHPGEVRGGLTSITVRYFHAVGADPVNPATGRPGAPTPAYTEFETFTLVRRRRDR